MWAGMQWGGVEIAECVLGPRQTINRVKGPLVCPFCNFTVWMSGGKIPPGQSPIPTVCKQLHTPEECVTNQPLIVYWLLCDSTAGWPCFNHRGSAAEVWPGKLLHYGLYQPAKEKALLIGRVKERQQRVPGYFLLIKGPMTEPPSGKRS